MAQCPEECNLFEAVNENSIVKLQLVLESYDLDEILESLIKSNENGDTPMVIAIKGRNVFIIEKLVKLFLECVEKERENGRRSQCFIVIEKLMQKIPILEWLDFFVNDLCDWSRLKNIAQILSNHPTSNQQHQIIALELVGAVIIMCFHRFRHVCQSIKNEIIMTGLDYWKKAMTIRYSPDSNGEPLYPKILVSHVPSEASTAVFGSAVEVNSMEEIDLLLQRPERKYNAFFLRIQGLLVIRRICMQANAGRPNWVYLQSLLELASDMWQWDTSYFVNTHLFIMEQLTRFDPHQLSTKISKFFIDILWILSKYFCSADQDDIEEEQVRRELSVPDKLIKVTKFVNTIVKFFPKPEMIAKFRPEVPQHRISFGEIIFFLMLMMETTIQQLTNQEEEELEKYFSYFIQNLFPERTTTPLHVAALVDCGYITEFHHESDITLEILCETVKRMLKLGADPNAIDERGETPLHVELVIFGVLPRFMPTFLALVNAGGHLDMANDEGETVISMLKKNVMEYNRYDEFVDPYFESLIAVFPLSYYAARVILQNGIPYDRLPSRLQQLVARQSAQDFDADDFDAE